MDGSVANRRLRVTDVYWRRAGSLKRWLSSGVVGSSTSFWALAICGVSGAMGGCSSDTVKRAVRLVMPATLFASSESVREEEAGSSSWSRVAVIAGTPGEKRLSRGALLEPASFASSSSYAGC